MKASPRSYAKALFEMTEEASKTEAKNIIDRFLNELKNKNMLSKIDVILEEYNRLDDEAEGIVRATITSVRHCSKTVLAEAEQLVLKRVKGKKIVWTQQLDPSILGGVRIASGDLIIDMSLAQRVNALATRITE
jgi:F-type H+-transporting ATPase subunit delta